MLVLRRKVDESVMVGDNVRVHVVRIDGPAVYLGFDAPGDVVVDRRELYEAKQREKAGTGEGGALANRSPNTTAAADSSES